jgi:hypothetical protein
MCTRDVKRVKQRHRIVGEAGWAVATPGCFTPSEAAQVRYEQAVVAELLDYAAPAPPVLRPAVQEQHRRPRAGRGQMQPDRAAAGLDVHPVVLDTRQGGSPSSRAGEVETAMMQSAIATLRS